MTLKDFVKVFDVVGDIDRVELYIDEENDPIYIGNLLDLKVACDCKDDIVDYLFDCAKDDDFDAIKRVKQAYYFKDYFLDEENSDGEPVWVTKTKAEVVENSDGEPVWVTKTEAEVVMNILVRE